MCHGPLAQGGQHNGVAEAVLVWSQHGSGERPPGRRRALGGDPVSAVVLTVLVLAGRQAGSVDSISSAEMGISVSYPSGIASGKSEVRLESTFAMKEILVSMAII